jgi:hypothetical protein
MEKTKVSFISNLLDIADQFMVDPPTMSEKPRGVLQLTGRAGRAAAPSSRGPAGGTPPLVMRYGGLRARERPAAAWIRTVGKGESKTGAGRWIGGRPFYGKEGVFG